MPLLRKSPLSPQSTSLLLSLYLPVSYLFLVVWPLSSSFCLLHHCVCPPISQSLQGGCASGSLSDHSASELCQSGWDTCWDPPSLPPSLSVPLVAEVAVSPMLPGSTHMLRHRKAGTVLDTQQAALFQTTARLDSRSLPRSCGMRQIGRTE